MHYSRSNIGKKEKWKNSALAYNNIFSIYLGLEHLNNSSIWFEYPGRTISVTKQLFSAG